MNSILYILYRLWYGTYHKAAIAWQLKTRGHEIGWLRGLAMEHSYWRTSIDKGLEEVKELGRKK